MFEGLYLVAPAKQDVELDAVCDSWKKLGGDVVRLDRFWEPPSIDPTTVRLYGSDTFCLVVAQKLGLHLVCPDDGMIASVDRRFLGRRVIVTSLGDAHEAGFPRFAKPVTPKIFTARVFETWESLRSETDGLAPETQILLADPVSIGAEARCFVLDRDILSCSLYEGDGNVHDAQKTAVEFASSYSLPKTCAIDLAYIVDWGWALLELNATWGSGLNNCDPRAVAQCLVHATSLP